jgi:hypothetical protein
MPAYEFSLITGEKRIYDSDTNSWTQSLGYRIYPRCDTELYVSQPGKPPKLWGTVKQVEEQLAPQILVKFYAPSYSIPATPYPRPLSPNAAMEQRARDYNPPIVCEDDSGNEKSYQSPEEWYAEVMAYLKKKKPDLAQVLWTVA